MNRHSRATRADGSRWFARRAAGRAVELVGWVILLSLATLAVLRWTHSDSRWEVIVAISLSPLLYMSAWIIAAIGAVFRRWALTAVAGALSILSIVWLVPQWYPFVRAAAPAKGAIGLRVFDANVQYSNPSLASIAGEIRTDHPDLITLEEYSYSNMQSLVSTGVLARYHWSYVQPAGGSYGFGVWSDIPMTGAQQWFAGPHPEVRAWLQPTGTPRVRLYVIHTDAPRQGGAAEWHQEMSAITQTLHKEQRPLLVVGDFNATWDMYEFQDILHLGLKDAAVEEGKGWEMTWSRQTRVLPPVVRIDHLLYSSGTTVAGYRTATGKGSDHRPIEIQLAINPSR